MTNGILFNWSAALGAYAVGGPLWAAVVFLSVALIRMSLESQNLRDEAEQLRRRVILLGGPFGLSDELPETEDVPGSGTRPTGLPRARAVS